MAIGSNHVVQSCIAYTGDTSWFIPELWSQEVLKAYYKQSVFMSNATDSKIYFTTTDIQKGVDRWLLTRTT